MRTALAFIAGFVLSQFCLIRFKVIRYGDEKGSASTVEEFDLLWDALTEEDD